MLNGKASRIVWQRTALLSPPTIGHQQSAWNGERTA